MRLQDESGKASSPFGAHLFHAVVLPGTLEQSWWQTKTKAVYRLLQKHFDANASSFLDFYGRLGRGLSSSADFSHASRRGSVEKVFVFARS